MDEVALEQARLQLETACAWFEDPSTRQQAEKALLDFRQVESPLRVCRYIIEHSASSAARFQALLTLREAAVRDWGHLPEDHRRSLRAYLMQCLLSGTAGSDQLVGAQLAALLAQVIKRGWTDQSKEEREHIFQELEAAVAGSGDFGARRRSMEALSAVVTEFSPPTASAMGLPWAYHERCRMSLEADFLQRFFAHACGVARQIAASGAAASGSDQGACRACIQLLSNILGWDFQRGGGGIGGGGFGYVPESAQKGGAGTETMQVHLGPGWRPILLEPGAFRWLLDLVAALQGRPGPTLSAARQLAVQLCGVSGMIFSQDPEGKEAKRLYCRELLCAVASWAPRPEALVPAADRGDMDLQEQLSDCCRGLLLLAMTHRASGFVAAAEGTELASVPDGVLGFLVGLTRALAACGGVEEGAEGTWSSACCEVLLDAWVALLGEGVAPAGSGGAKQDGGLRALPDAVHAVFEALAAGALRDLAAGLACEDDDEGEEGGAAVRADEWMGRLAVLGRAAARRSLPLLSLLVRQRLQQLESCAASGSDPSAVLEELCWALRCASHVLADSGAGETPMLPVPLLDLYDGAGDADPVQELSTGLLTVASLCLDPAARRVVSPRLLEVASSAAARWLRTYLIPEEELPKPLAEAFGVGGGGPRILETLVKVSMEILREWPGEVQLHLVQEPSESSPTHTHCPRLGN